MADGSGFQLPKQYRPYKPSLFDTASRGFVSAGRFLARLVRAAPPGEISLFPIGNRIAGFALYEPAEALKLAAVWRAVSVVSSSIAMLPWCVYRRTGVDTFTAEPDHGVTWLLDYEPSADLTAYTWRRSMIMHAMLAGGGYSEIERTGRGEPYALHLLEPGRVSPKRRNNGALAYEVRQRGGDSVVLDAEDVFHWPGLAWDGIAGFTVMDGANRSISLAGAMEDFASQYFAQGMRPSGFIKTNGNMSPDSLKSLMERISATFSGPRNQWKPVPLDKGMEWQDAQDNFVDSEFIDMRKFSLQDICRWFGVPPHLVYDLERATFSNIEQQNRDFMTYSLLPMITPGQQEADKKLLNSNYGRTYTWMDTKAFAAGDMDARGKFYQIMVNLGIYSANDVLRAEGESTIGAEGDVRVRQMQYQPVQPDGSTLAPEPKTPAYAPSGSEGGGDTAPTAKKKRRRARRS